MVIVRPVYYIFKSSKNEINCEFTEEIWDGISAAQYTFSLLIICLISLFTTKIYIITITDDLQDMTLVILITVSKISSNVVHIFVIIKKENLLKSRPTSI